MRSPFRWERVGEMPLGAAALAALIIRGGRIARAMEVDELDRVAVGIVEIGVAASEAAVTLVLVEQHLDALRLRVGERGVEVCAVEHEGVVDQGIPPAVRWRVIAGARQHEILLAAAHEHGAVILPPEGRAYDLLVEAPGAVEVGHAEREMQDAAWLDRPRGGVAHAAGAPERRALEFAHLTVPRPRLRLRSA